MIILNEIISAIFLPRSIIVWRFFVQGYFILLLKSIEANLRAWNVSLLTAPVDPEMAQIWSEKLGFTILSAEEVTTFSVAYSSGSWHDEIIQLIFWAKTNWILQIVSFVLLILTVLSLTCCSVDRRSQCWSRTPWWCSRT